MAVVILESARAGRAEDENWPRDAGRTQLGTFFDRRDALAPGVGRLEALTYKGGPAPVRVGFDEREEPSACYLCYRSGVVDEGVHVHFDPGFAAR